ncbi:hypothetical protein [Pseudomonas typographi]|uniref:hypothetical protein n=1 Tax=Pseudomonas typographi TaxID=2715964 RepID=UPI00168804D2|nr:hypothetical protein [Pseudomonas typographi]MBD1551662.1 hypothetical protein [Pseudomonas typographi]
MSQPILISVYIQALEAAANALYTCQSRALLVKRQAPAYHWLEPQQIAPFEATQKSAWASATQVLDKGIAALITTVKANQGLLTSLSHIGASLGDTAALAALLQSNVARASAHATELSSTVALIKDQVDTLLPQLDALVHGEQGAVASGSVKVDTLKRDIEALSKRLHEINLQLIELARSQGSLIGGWVTHTVKILPPVKAVAGPPGKGDEGMVIERIEVDVNAFAEASAQAQALKAESDRVFKRLAGLYVSLFEQKASIAVTLALFQSIKDLAASLGRSLDKTNALDTLWRELAEGWSEKSFQQLLAERTALVTGLQRIEAIGKELSGSGFVNRQVPVSIVHTQEA